MIVSGYNDDNLLPDCKIKCIVNDDELRVVDFQLGRSVKTLLSELIYFEDVIQECEVYVGKEKLTPDYNITDPEDVFDVVMKPAPDGFYTDPSLMFVYKGKVNYIDETIEDLSDEMFSRKFWRFNDDFLKLLDLETTYHEIYGCIVYKHRDKWIIQKHEHNYFATTEKILKMKDYKRKYISLSEIEFV